MELIEQAVFTSAETDRSAGYQVVAASPQISEADLRELAVWGPSHGALLDSSPSAVSYNFHPLPSGCYCASRTTPGGQEYSKRGGARVYTQCLIVPPRALARFANNPFALLRAALAAGALELHEEVPKRLEPFRLSGRTAVVDSALLARLCAHPGPDGLASLVQAALSSTTVAVTGDVPPEQLIAGLINCLPPECRPLFSFSTGLRYSSRRPFRVVAVSDDAEERLRVRRLYDVALLDFSQRLSDKFAPVESWARFIQRVLKSGRTSWLAGRLADRRGDFALADLPALGLQLLEELDASSLADSPAPADESGAESPRDDSQPEDPWTEVTWEEAESPAEPAGGDPWSDEFPGQQRSGDEDDGSFPFEHSNAPDRGTPCGAESLQHAHRPHPGLGENVAAGSAWCKPTPPSALLDPDDPEVLAKLERLDDLVYDAIDGNVEAIHALGEYWPKVCEELGEEMLAESQEQYLRYALSTWTESIQPDALCQPQRAIHSLEVLCVLFNQR
jgi:hypothetical protein